MIHSLYKGEIEIDFKENPWHTYTLIKDKKILAVPVKLMGTTTATGIVDKSEQMKYWATGVMQDTLLADLDNITTKGAEYATLKIKDARSKYRQVSKDAAEIGTQIHEWIEHFIKDKKTPELPKQKEVLLGVTAFLNWVDQHKVKFVHSEKLVYSRKYRFVGTLDAVAIIDGKRCVVDYKSSSGIYSTFFYQTAGYQGAYEEETGIALTGNRWIIKLGKTDGEFLAYERDSFKEDFKSFLLCLGLKRAENALIPTIKSINGK